MKILTTYEYSEISYEAIVDSIGDSKNFQLIKELETLCSEKYAASVEFKLNGVAFKNFVGVIKVGDTYIEVLPKIYNSLRDDSPSLNKSEIYKNINYMINKSPKLSIKNIELTSYGENEDGQFLDFFINMFLQELYTNLFKGLYKTYVSQQDNLRYIKGRLLVAENIKRNFLHNKVYCEFDEFTEDNLVNQILKYTTKLMSKLTNWRKNQLLACNILQFLDDVSDIHVSLDTFSFIKDDRLLGIYSKLLVIAKMFLEGQSIDINSENQTNFIFNIDMNLVYQEYIFEILKEYSVDIFGENITIKSQYSKEHLIYNSHNKGVFPLKPDIAILEGNHINILVDTKYKKLNKEKPRNGVSDKDLYQMFGYFHKYGKPLIFLLYPRYESDISDYYRFERFKDPLLFVNTVTLSNKLYTAEGELAIVSALKSIFKNQSMSQKEFNSHKNQ